MEAEAAHRRRLTSARWPCWRTFSSCSPGSSAHHLLGPARFALLAFHAVQAVIWQIVFFALAMLSMVACFVVMFSMVLTHPSSSNGPPAGFLVAFPLILLVRMGGWVIGITLAVVYGIKANQGEWAGYPVIGRWARRLARV